MTNVLREMLLIEEDSVFKLYEEMVQIAKYLVMPAFMVGIILEYFGEMNFGDVLKKLLIVMVVLTSFYTIHTKAVDISLELASNTLKQVSPNNFFVKKWYHSKIATTKAKGWGSFKDIVIPNLNDLLATAYYLMAKVFTWLLKLIYSAVYHLTYVFSGISALLYFFGWTKNSLKGTIQSSLWCIIMPFVVISILALVGNSISGSAGRGELAMGSIDTILWLFGITLLLLLTPVITLGMVRGDGISSAGAQMGSQMVSTGMKVGMAVPFISTYGGSAYRKAQGVYKRIRGTDESEEGEK